MNALFKTKLQRGQKQKRERQHMVRSAKAGS